MSIASGHPSYRLPSYFIRASPVLRALINDIDVTHTDTTAPEWQSTFNPLSSAPQSTPTISRLCSPLSGAYAPPPASFEYPRLTFFPQTRRKPDRPTTVHLTGSPDHAFVGTNCGPSAQLSIEPNALFPPKGPSVQFSKTYRQLVNLVSRSTSTRRSGCPPMHHLQCTFAVPRPPPGKWLASPSTNTHHPYRFRRDV